MKAILDEMNACYERFGFNKKQSFCHSMDTDSYKIVYKEFFANPKNVLFEKQLAEENLADFAQNTFINWLNEE